MVEREIWAWALQPALLLVVLLEEADPLFPLQLRPMRG
jgi:hypothetical protein